MDDIKKTKGHLFYVASSFVHHFIAIGEFKLKLQSGNAQFGSKSVIYCPVWSWNLTDDHKNNRAPLLCCFKLCASLHSHRWIQTSYSPEHPQFGPKSAIFVLCDLEIWWMTLKNNRSPLPRYFKLCASFRSHWWIGVTVRKRPIWVKIDDLLSRVTLKFDGWPWKTIEQHQYLCIISSSYVNSNWSYSPETAKLGYDLCDLDLWPMTLTFCMGITSVIDNNSWKFRDDTIAET